jgi:hypothetical protein
VNVARADRARLELAVAQAVREADTPKADQLRRVLAELPAAAGAAPLELAPPRQAPGGGLRLPSLTEFRVMLVGLLRRLAGRLDPGTGVTGTPEETRP